MKRKTGTGVEEKIIGRAKRRAAEEGQTRAILFRIRLCMYLRKEAATAEERSEATFESASPCHHVIMGIKSGQFAIFQRT
jgi:hypothetical protein